MNTKVKPESKESYPALWIPDNPRNVTAFNDGLNSLKRHWPLQDKKLPEITIPSSKNDNLASHDSWWGYLSIYPTYCLIAWVVPDTSQYKTQLHCLKMVIVACHLIMWDKITGDSKHFQSRLCESLRIFREACDGKHDRQLAGLPTSVKSLEEYDRALKILTAGKTNNRFLEILNRCLNGALTDGGGYTRDVGTRRISDETVGLYKRAIEAEELHGQVIRNVEQLNNNSICTSLRLSYEESGTGPIFYKEEQPINPTRGETYYQAVRKARGRKSSIIRMSQLIPHAWERLSLFDISNLFNNLEEFHKNINDINLKEIRAIIALVFWLGRPISEILKLRIVPDYSSLPVGTIRGYGFIVLTPTVVVMPKYRPAGAKEVSETWGSYVRASSDRVYLPLPEAACREIRPFLQEKSPAGNRGVRLFDQNKDYEPAVKDILKVIRERTNARITLVRLARQMPISVAAHCGDRIIAALAMATCVGNQTHAGTYYCSVSQIKLAGIYWQYAARLSADLLDVTPYEVLPMLPDSANNTYVGSNVCPKDSGPVAIHSGFYSLFVHDLRMALGYVRKLQHKPDFTIKFHNLFTCYCVSMLAIATGYRAVRNPLKDIRILDEKTGWVVISDKESSENNARLVWIPELLIKQLQEYGRYREKLIRILGLPINQLRFFFFVDAKRSAQEVTPQSLGRYIKWTNKLPLNANRHFLRSYLVERNVPGEIIDAYMGHGDLGEEPYGPYSALSPIDFRNELAPVLTEMLTLQGWEVEYALSDTASSAWEAQSSGLTCNENTHQTGKHDRNKSNREEDKLTLEKQVNTSQPQLNSKEPGLHIPPNHIDMLFNTIIRNKEFHDWRYAHNQLTRKIKEKADKYKWNVITPSPIIVLNQPLSLFTPESFQLLLEIRKIEERFIDSLQKLNPYDELITSKLNDYLQPSRKKRKEFDISTLLTGQILFSAARYGGLLSNKLLTALLEQISTGGFQLNNQLVFDLMIGKHTKRFYADQLTCALILRYRELVNKKKVSMCNDTCKEIFQVFIRALVSGRHKLEKDSEFLSAASTAWRMDKPAFLYNWGRGTAVSVSWSKETEIRVRTGQRLSHQRTESVLSNDQHSPAQAVVYNKHFNDVGGAKVECDLNKAYGTLYDALKAKNFHTSWRKQISKQLRKWSERNADSVGLIPLLLAEWARSIAINKCNVHTAVRASSSLRTYIGRIGRVLFIASKDFPPEEYDNQHLWKVLYKEIVDSKKSLTGRIAAITECQHFHNFVVAHLDVLPLSVGEAVGIGPVSNSISVNANYITPDEFAHCANWLTGHSQEHKYLETAFHTMTLAYWAGLRIGEVAALKLGDIQVVYNSIGQIKDAEILVQSHPEHKVKTESSRRRVPIACLMPDTYLNKFIQFFQQKERQYEDMDRSDEIFLFSAEGSYSSMPDEQDIRIPATSILRKVTGDHSIVFHHLRHSAANNWLIGLLSRSKNDKIWELFHRPPKLLQEVAENLNDSLMGNNNRRRGVLYAVASLLGHSDPSTTLQSYEVV